MNGCLIGLESPVSMVCTARLVNPRSFSSGEKISRYSLSKDAFAVFQCVFYLLKAHRRQLVGNQGSFKEK